MIEDAQEVSVKGLSRPLTSTDAVQGDDEGTPDTQHSRKLVAVLDTLNRRYGSEVVVFAATGVQRRWAMRRDRCSARYTTSWTDLLEV